MTENSRTASAPAGRLSWLLATLTVLAVLYVRIRLLHVPLERDEGEYAYMGQLLLEGIPPYVNAYSMKLPGVSALYALFMALFGHSSFGIHLGLLLVNAGSIALVYLLAARVAGRQAAPYAAASYALLSLSKTVYGVFAHATQFVVLFALAGFVLLLRPAGRHRLATLFAAGLCFGLAFTMKQPAALFALYALLLVAWDAWRGRAGRGLGFLKEPAVLLAGVALPYGAILLWVLSQDAFDAFWFWTVSYASEYAAGQPLDLGLKALVNNFAVIFVPQFPLWLLALAGGAGLAVRGGRLGERRFLAGLFLFSFLALCPGFYFRWHYFILILPVVSILIGVAAAWAGELAQAPGVPPLARPLVPVLLVLVALGYGMYKERVCFFELSPLEMSYSTYGTSPFPAAEQIGDYLKAHSSPSDTVAVFGSEPEIYFYAGRRSATGHIYMYGLMEAHPYAAQMQREMISQVEGARPKYCVLAKMPFSWLMSDSSPQLLMDWMETWLRAHYDRVGVVEVWDNGSRARWDADAAGYQPQTPQHLLVYRRKG